MSNNAGTSNVNTLTDAQHNEIAELLPDFAIGTLSDGELLRVESHLQVCIDCRAEFAQLLDVVSVLPLAAPPSVGARHALFGRAGHPLSGLDPGVRPLELVPVEPAAPPANVRRLPSQFARFALLAAVIALLVLGGWSVWLQRELSERESLVALISEPANAYPLTDSEVPSDATAIFYVDPERDDALLTAQNVPALADDQRYQIWLFTESGERVDGGLFTPDADGNVSAVVESAEPLAEYWAVGVSVEPHDGSEAPTSPLILGGWIQ